MRLTLLPLVGAVLCSQAFAQPHIPEGFRPLFNGKDLSGWFGWGTSDPATLRAMSPEERLEYKSKSIRGGLVDAKGNLTQEHIENHWRVENRELVNDGKGLYLTTDSDYGDFELMLEYKALPEGDSGVYLRGIPQVQIWDAGSADPNGLGKSLGSGGLWNNGKGAPGKDPARKMDRALGEWNSFKIRMLGERVTVIFNGETVVDHEVLENFFANKKSGYLAYGKDLPGTVVARVNELMLDPVHVRGPIQLQTHGRYGGGICSLEKFLQRKVTGSFRNAMRMGLPGLIMGLILITGREQWSITKRWMEPSFASRAKAAPC